mgnify:CR=1 FL=1
MEGRRKDSDASLSSWLSLVEDLYHNNYDMFHDFPGWATPSRRFTQQGDLAPITTNILDLEVLESYDPALKPLYDILRYEEAWDALQVPGASFTPGLPGNALPECGQAERPCLLTFLAFFSVYLLPMFLGSAKGRIQNKTMCHK